MNSSEVKAAIKSEELSSFCISILDDADDLTKIFDDIDTKVNELKDCLDSELLEIINSEYEELKNNYNIIHNNITTYSEDFIAVKNIIESGMKDILINFQTETEEIRKQNKEVI